MFIKILLISIILLVIAAIGFGITMLLKPKGKFPELHISGNEAMRNRGITCATRTDVGCRTSGSLAGGCSACSGDID